ncbi:hypothetical protein [Brevibacillus dissolubilis]|uniref:hypothetical protein n=1 Tax=Brevibacillus dissolubilis TaxID=1844116 RepID=UPI001116FD25|nr:hypothetical protein [Brevibacillus dissolubilis]
MKQSQHEQPLQAVFCVDTGALVEPLVSFSDWNDLGNHHPVLADQLQTVLHTWAAQVKLSAARHLLTEAVGEVAAARYVITMKEGTESVG